MKTQAGSRWNSEVRVLALLAVFVSVLSFFAYLQRGDVLLYGDAVAHINIARRIFDSRTPGLLQLGTVWLPLPHLLMVPFLLSHKMWQTGAGGSIPSLIAYVLGVVGMFRLTRGALVGQGEISMAARLGAWIAALVYGANPNLIYMQTTAMGESVYLACFIWAVVYFSEFVRGDEKALTKCGLCVAAACWTRYDGWFLGVAIVCGVVASLVTSRSANVGRADARPDVRGRVSANKLVQFVLIAAAAPMLWIAYNAIVYRNPLEFENGPYSAKAIEKKTQSSGAPGHPGMGNLYVAGHYFLKAAEFNVADNEWLGRAWVLLALAAIMCATVDRGGNTDGQRQGRAGSSLTAKGGKPEGSSAHSTAGPCWPLLLLLAPAPFYALSVAYGGVPIFIPAWWPFTHYNVRYGLQLLPAFAAAAGVVAYCGWKSRAWGGLLRRTTLLLVAALVVASYGSVWHATPICLAEARINMRSRNALEWRVAQWLKLLPPDSTLLMYVGDHVGAVEHAGIPLRRVINEGNHRVWKQPSDPDGLWERSLRDPASQADYALAFDGDSVWQAVRGRGFRELVEINVSGQDRAVLYRLR